MIAEFLSEENKKKVDAANFNPEAWVRFWDTEKVEIDGKITLEELRTIVRLMEGFEK